MSLEVSYTNEDALELPLSAVDISELFEFVLAEEGIERACAVELTILSPAQIQELNSEWRGVNTPTDVLSFECERPDDPDLADGEVCELGDIFIAPEVLDAQSQKFGTTFANECRLMLIHSLLHLLGYDHIEESDAQVMEAREDELLAKITNNELSHVVLTRHNRD